MNHGCKQLYAEFISICIRRQWRRQCSGIVSNNAAHFLNRVMNGDQSQSWTVTFALLCTFRKSKHITCWLDNGRQLHRRSASDRFRTGLTFTAEAAKSYVFRLKTPSSGYFRTGLTFTSRSCKELRVSA